MKFRNSPVERDETDFFMRTAEIATLNYKNLQTRIKISAVSRSLSSIPRNKSVSQQVVEEAGRP